MENKNNDADIFNKCGGRSGFTLIELLVVIAIIGALASVVTTSVSSGKEKANRAAALSALTSIMPEMTMCAIDGGGTDGYAAGHAICTDGDGLVVAGHAGAVWPDIAAKTGWTITALQKGMIDDDYAFGAAKSGQVSIVCSVKENSCR